MPSHGHLFLWNRAKYKYLRKIREIRAICGSPFISLKQLKNQSSAKNPRDPRNLRETF